MFNNTLIGTVEGTGSAINVSSGFQPRAVEIVNIDSVNPVKPKMRWITGMAAASALKAAGNVCLADAGLLIGTTATKVKIANTVVFLNKGVFKSKATAEEIFTTAHSTADLTTTKYLISLTAAGGITITKGNEALTATLATIPSLVPSTPAGTTAIGYVQLVASGSAFVGGTDNLSQGTDTYVDYSSLGGEEKITADGITVYAGSSSAGEGFSIGADADVNVSGETILWKAYR